MRYESLQAARRNRTQTGEKLDELRVIAPLYTEEIYSLFDAIHLPPTSELRGARLTWAAQSNRALIAGRLHESMFAEPMKPPTAVFQCNEALRTLVNGKTIDAMIVVSAQPASGCRICPRTLRNH